VISIVLCTFNRHRVLEETVRSFFDCRLDGIDYELLIVDNNSADETREFGERLAGRNPHVRYVLEERQGLSHARNRGIGESRGEIIAFVDDDVYFSPHWLKALESSFGRNGGVACIGGKVVPHFESGRPTWIEDSLLWIYGVTRYGEQEREIRPPEIPIGCNMAFRRAVFERIGGFHTSLGRKGENLLSGEEKQLFNDAANAGMKTLYSPDVQVSHRIPPSRTTRKWILSRLYWEGISDVAMKQIGIEPLTRVLLAKKAIKTLFVLLRRWRDTAGYLDMGNLQDGDCPIGAQADIGYRIGALRQSIREVIAARERNDDNGGRRGIRE
jgi:glycosyltransferase involved in cell wall biosynthesis